MTFHQYVTRAYGTTPDGQMLRELRQEDEAVLAGRNGGTRSSFALTNQERMEQRQRDLESLLPLFQKVEEEEVPQTAHNGITALQSPQPAPGTAQPVKAPRKASQGHGQAPQGNGADHRPATAKGARFELHGHPVTAVLRWMGKAEWSKEEARKHLDANGCKEVSDSTIGVQLSKGRKGLEFIPDLKLNKGK